MLSLRARLVVCAMTHRHLLRPPFRRTDSDWSTFAAIERFRQEVERGAGRFGRLPVGIESNPVDCGGIRAEWVSPAAAVRDRALLYFHGGGYVSGSIPAHRAIVAKFAGGSAIPALLFEYRLAPEHRFPAALEDALAVYRWLLSEGKDPSHIAFCGDSAGGGLALATLLALKDTGLPLPAAAAVLSPVTDFTCSGDSYRTNARTCLSPPGMGQACARHYCGDQDPAHPYVSPLFGQLEGLPPLLVYAGSEETLLDDSTRFAARARAAGVDVRLEIGRGLFHCYPACSPLFPEARQAMADICAFLRTHTGLPAH